MNNSDPKGNGQKKSFRRSLFTKMNQYPNISIIYRTVAIILVWSGIWGLSDELIFPDDPLIRAIIVLFVGLFLLYIDDFSLSELFDIHQFHNSSPSEVENENNEESQEKDSKMKE